MRARVTFFLFLFLGCEAETATQAAGAGGEEQAVAQVRDDKREQEAVPMAEGEVPAWAKDELEFPNECEEFEVRIDDKGRARYKRLRRKWTDEDRERFRNLVSMVAKEMGADPRLFTIWALRESTYRPDAIHILNHDLEANAEAWELHKYSAEREQELEALMQDVGARHPKFWNAKAELARIRRFKDNPYYFDNVRFPVHMPTGEVVEESRSRWAYGYGPFGFNAAYFLATWDAQAPPWVFCNHDGIVAVVTAVWSARKHQQECVSLGFPGSYEDVNRRFSSGHCRPRPARDRLFHRRATARGLPYQARAKLGRKWPQDTSDRTEILEHMVRRAQEKGLLSTPAPAP